MDEIACSLEVVNNSLQKALMNEWYTCHALFLRYSLKTVSHSQQHYTTTIPDLYYYENDK